MDNKRRYFVQYMLKNGSVTTEEALSFCKKLSPVGSLTSLRKLIADINREIAEQHFTIAITTCEVTGDDVVVWLNTKNDDLSKLQLGFSAIELEYFHAIMQEIITSSPHQLEIPACINIASTLSAPFSRENGQRVLDKWLSGGYFVKQGDSIHFGARTLLEFMTYLRVQAGNCLCELCSELVFTGKNCANCDKTFHSVCFHKFFKRNRRCPSCKSAWHEDAIQTTSNGYDSPEPSTSRL